MTTIHHESCHASLSIYPKIHANRKQLYTASGRHSCYWSFLKLDPFPFPIYKVYMSPTPSNLLIYIEKNHGLKPCTMHIKWQLTCYWLLSHSNPTRACWQSIIWLVFLVLLCWKLWDIHTMQTTKVHYNIRAQYGDLLCVTLNKVIVWWLYRC